MSSATLLRAYRLAVRREARAWLDNQLSVPRSVSGVIGNAVPQSLLDQWEWCAARERRYGRFCRRLETRLLERLGAGRA